MATNIDVGPLSWRRESSIPLTEIPLSRVTRRDVLAGIAAGTGFAFALTLAGPARADRTAGGLKDVRGGDATPGLFISIEEDGTVKLTCHRSEMGQQTWTAMAQIMADELEADWDRISIVQAIGHPKYGDQNTDGSRSVRRNLTRLRYAGAGMRHMLREAAAKRWDVPGEECRATLHEVVHAPTGRRLGYGELAAAAAEMPVPGMDAVTLKERAEWRYIGKPVASLTVPDIVVGKGTFGIDVQMPDMVYAVIARPPVVFGRVKSVDDTETLKVSGVLRTVQLDTAEPPAQFKPLGGVAVIADNTWSALEGRAALKIEWEPGPNGDYDSDQFRDQLLETARKPGQVRRSRGDVQKALDSAAKRISADYYAPHLSQSPMEPPAATARWDGDRCEVLACVQAPQATRAAIAGACDVDPENVIVTPTWLGGAFGRKSKPDFAVEAAILAREVGKPVKVTWSREDDLRHGYLHSVSAQHMEGGLDEDGRCTAFLHRTVFPPIPSTFQEGVTEPSWGELRLGASDNPFIVPNFQLETGPAPAKVRIGWLRSVANVYHAFAIQSFAAELAAAAGRDQKDFLLDLIGPPRLVDPREEGAEYDNYGDPMEEYPIDTGRLANVTKMAAEMAGWGRTPGSGRGLGIAAHRSFLTYVATVVEVEVDDKGRLTIPGVWSAIDAGTVVNTRHVEAQMEGGCLYGLSNALYGEITARNGAIEQENFPSWRLMKMSESPKHFEVKIMESDAPPGGVGEPPTPPAAPALTNAIFAATGQRIRRLPIFGANNDRLDSLGGEQS
ncbi:MAG: molybdopterin-dependent oxidoreductase [Gammaproteobacteria bacterium]